MLTLLRTSGNDLVLVRHMYRWWTVDAWGDGIGFGVKLGPISIGAYRWDWRPNAYISFLGRWTLDTFWTGH